MFSPMRNYLSVLFKLLLVAVIFCLTSCQTQEKNLPTQQTEKVFSDIAGESSGFIFKQVANNNQKLECFTLPSTRK